MPELLGRTNQTFPPVWLSLSMPSSVDQLPSLVSAAKASGVPIDVTGQRALWGGELRGSQVPLMCLSDATYENATDDRHAGDLIQAHLLETLSSIGREQIDFYFLRVRRMVEEFQLAGVFEALEVARQEGHIRFLGICCDGPSLATLGVWQFHDAFEVLMVPRNHYDPEPYETLSPMALERRVGVLGYRPLNWGFGLPFVKLPSQWRLRNLTQGFYGLSLAQAVVGDLSRSHPLLVGVSSVAEVEQALEAPTLARPEGLSAFLQPYIEAFDSDEEWEALNGHPDPLIRSAARRRAAWRAGSQ